jgi:hypothetical protein
MKHYTLLLVVIILMIANYAIAGVVGQSPYDKTWDIYVSECSGSTVIYYDCVITNLGQRSISFIPDQGRIPTGNGKEITVNKTGCTSVMTVQHD